MWQACEYKEWRGELPWDEGKAVFACVWPLGAGPASVKWVELVEDENPREVEPVHHAVRALAFWELEDEGG